MSQGNPTKHEIDVYCAEWILNGGDQSKAWRKAYPKSTSPEKVGWEKGSTMHKMIKVKERLAELQAETAAKDAEEFDVSVATLKEILMDVMNKGREKDDNGKYASLSAATSAVNELNRMNGNHAASKVNHGVQDNNPIVDLLAQISGKTITPND